MMASLRGRLLVALTALVLLAGTAAGVVGFRWAFEEANELQDAILQQVAALAADNRLVTGPSAVRGIDAEARVMFEELGPALPTGAGPAAQASGLPDTLPDGFQAVRRGGEAWRVLVRTRRDGTRFAVSQRAAGRDEIARDSALRTVLPLAALIPCLALLVALVIHRSFEPLTRLSALLDAGQADPVGRLPSAGIPAELLPFVASINRLLERNGAMLNQQRRFVADAAHELRTPITALSLQAENLDRAGAGPPDPERLAALRGGIQRTAHLLEQLLALARSEAGPCSDGVVTPLDTIAKEAVADSLPLARSRGIDLGFGLLETVAVSASPTDLRALVGNLVDNAVRHGAEGGRVDLYVRREGRSVILRVEDDGPGIPEADLSRVFDPFVRGAAATPGSGLGLSIVSKVVDRAGARITLENASAGGRSGLRVTVAFPLTCARPACRAAGSSDRDPRVGSGPWRQPRP